jgi:putative acetyltransferase
VSAITIRLCTPDDYSPLADLVRRAIREIAIKDYSVAQVAAWAPDDTDMDRFVARYGAKPTFVAEIGGAIAGFIDVEPDGHIDRLFVHPDFQRRGVANTLIEYVVDYARSNHQTRLFVEASITARSSFERQGFQVVSDQIVEFNGERFRNYRLERLL